MNTVDIVEKIDKELRTLPPIGWPITRRLLLEAKNEILRLREGRLTVEEFHNLCNNRPCVTEEEHEEQCRVYRRKLFPRKDS